MNKIYFLLVSSIVFASCQGNKTSEKKEITPESIKSEIKILDDSLSYFYQQIKENKISDIHPNHIIATVQKYLEFYHKFPKDPYAPVCLDKVQQLYTQQKQYYLVLNFCDTLLIKYPSYKENAMILLNAGSIADGILQDKKKVEKYYGKLLKDYPKLDKETREMIAFRLKHIDLTFDQMIEMQAKNLSKK